MYFNFLNFNNNVCWGATFRVNDIFVAAKYVLDIWWISVQSSVYFYLVVKENWKDNLGTRFFFSGPVQEMKRKM